MGGVGSGSEYRFFCGGGSRRGAWRDDSSLSQDKKEKKRIGERTPHLLLKEDDNTETDVHTAGPYEKGELKGGKKFTSYPNKRATAELTRRSGVPQKEKNGEQSGRGRRLSRQP